MALVLAIEPDHRQSTILKRIVKEKVRADVVVVDSPDAALASIRAHVPDVLLLSALLSPRDEDELISHLRSLDGADHIQTHTIPQLASTGAYQDDPGRNGKGLLGLFKRGKKDSDAPVPGCDPELFADEIRAFLQRAAEKKAEGVAVLQSRVDRLEYEVASSASSVAAAAQARHDAPAVEESAASSSASSWASPFEWRRTPSSPPPTYEQPAEEPAPEPLAAMDLLAPAPIEEVEAAPMIEEPAAYVYEPPPAVDAAPELEPIVAAAPLEEIKPVEEPPLRSSRRAKRSSSSLEPATVLRLTPLAMWARSETAAEAGNGKGSVHEPQTATDELRSLIATLAVPAHVAGVSYGRGCRIRRVRVPGGKERRTGDAPGPVILSKRALEEQRSDANR